MFICLRKSSSEAESKGDMDSLVEFTWNFKI